jgi:hypothetical protein
VLFQHGEKGADVGFRRDTIDLVGLHQSFHELLSGCPVGERGPKNSPRVVDRHVNRFARVHGDDFSLDVAPFERVIAQPKLFRHLVSIIPISHRVCNENRRYDGFMADEQTPTRRLQERLYQPLRGLPDDGLLTRKRHKLVRWISNLVFERGVSTSKTEVEIDHFHPDRVAYEASDWLDLRRALNRRKIRPDDVFIDFGSGKGRIVYQAARYPFARVIGVEISPKLSELARENLKQSRSKLACPNVEIVTMDAAAYEIPDDVTIAYLYHPFGGETFEAVIGNIIESLDRNPRRMTLIYQMPWREDHLLGTGRFELVRTLKRPRKDPRRIAVYESTDAR